MSERKVVTFVNHTGQDILIRLHLKNCTGEEIPLGTAESTKSVQRTFPGQTYARYVVYDSTGKERGELSSDDLDGENNTVTVTEQFELRFSASARSSWSYRIWNGFKDKIRSQTILRESTSGFQNGTSSAETSEENV